MFPQTRTDSLPPAVVQQAAKLSPQERLALVLDYADTAQQVCLLQGQEGFVMMAPEPQDGENDFEALLPVWPHADLVPLWASPDMSNATVTTLALHEFVDTWLPGLEKNNIGLVVFPVSGEAHMVLSAQELADSLEEGTIQREP